MHTSDAMAGAKRCSSASMEPICAILYISGGHTSIRLLFSTTVLAIKARLGTAALSLISIFCACGVEALPADFSSSVAGIAF